MEFTKNFIERGDFPQVRRGHDPEAVSAHLRSVAEKVEDLKKQMEGARTRDKGSAASAGEHVRAIIEAAEQAAEQLEQTARSDSESMRSVAKAEAERTVTDARTEADSTLSSARAEA